jgi:WW domain/zinc-finger of a C2HC-type
MVDGSALFDAHCNAESDAEFGFHRTTTSSRSALVLPVASRSADRLAWGTEISSSSGSSGSSSGSSSCSPDSKVWQSESAQSSAVSSQLTTPARSAEVRPAIETSPGVLSGSYSVCKPTTEHTVPSTSARLNAALVNLDTAQRLIPHAALSPQHNRSVRITALSQGEFILAPFSGELGDFSSVAEHSVVVPITPVPLAVAPKASISEHKAVTAAAASVDVPALGDEWKQGTAPNGRVYYYNRRTRVSRWRLPAGAVTVPSGFDTDGSPVNRIFAPATAAVSTGKPTEEPQQQQQQQQRQQTVVRSVQAERGQQRANAAAAVRAAVVTPESAARRPSTASPSTAAAAAAVRKAAATTQRRPLTAVTASVSNSAAGAVSTTSAATAATVAAATVTPVQVSSSAVSVRAKVPVRTPVTPSGGRRVTPAARSTAKTPPSKAAAAAAAAVRGATRVFADLTPVSLDTRLRPAAAATGGRRAAVKHSPRAAVVVDSGEKQCDTAAAAAADGDELVSSINLEHSSFSSDVRGAGYTATKYSPVRHSYSGSLALATATTATPAAVTTAAAVVPPSTGNSSSTSGTAAAAAALASSTAALADSCDSAALAVDAPLAAGNSPEPPASVVRHAPRRQLFTEDAAAQPCVYCPYCGVRFLPGELRQHVTSCVVVERARDGQTQRCVVAALLPTATIANATATKSATVTSGGAANSTVDKVEGSGLQGVVIAATAAPMAGAVAVRVEGGSDSANDSFSEAVQAIVPSVAAEADAYVASTTATTIATAAVPATEQRSDNAPTTIGKAVNTIATTAAAGATEQCAECQRTFAAGRLQAHESVCKRVFGSRRPVFDATQRRLKGTPLEFFTGSEPASSSTPSSSTTTAAAASTAAATGTAATTGSSGAAAAVTPLLARRSSVRPASARAGTGGRAAALKASTLRTPAVVRFDSSKLSSAGSKSAPPRITDITADGDAVAAAVAVGVQAGEQRDSSSRGGELLVAAAAVQTAVAVFACPKCEDSSSQSRQELLQHLQQCLLGIVAAPTTDTVAAAASGTKSAAELSKQQLLSKSLHFSSSNSMSNITAAAAINVETAAAGVEDVCLCVFCERPCAKAALSRHLLKCKQLRESRERRAQVSVVDTPPPRQASTWHSDQQQQQQQQRSGSRSAGSKCRPSSRYGVRNSSSSSSSRHVAVAMAGCPHCGRSFAAAAAPHHIAICERVVCRAGGRFANN